MPKFLHQGPNILNSTEDVDGEAKVSRTLGISHQENGILFFFETEEDSLLVSDASQYVWNPIKRHLCDAPSFYRSKKSLLPELNGRT